jgi:hypothetical protein
MSAQAFFEDLRARVPKTMATCTGVLAGRPVTYRSSHGMLLRSVEHILPPPDYPAPINTLTLHAWDSTEEPNWDPTKQEVHSLVSDRYSAVLEGDRLYAYDRATREGFFWTPSIARLDALERSTPFRPILHWWAHQEGIQLTHAAVVGHLDEGVLLAGPGGAGKSTAALACLADGLDILGDDYCLVATNPVQATAWSVYNTAKLDDASLYRLHTLEGLVFGRDTGPKQKNLLDLRYGPDPKSLAHIMVLKAIVVPQIGDCRTSLVKTSPAKALAALAPSTMFQLPNERQETFKKLSTLVRQLPCYTLNLGPDLTTIGGLVDDIIEKRI